MTFWRLLGIAYVLGIATAVVAYFVADALRPDPSDDVGASYSAIRTLRLTVDAQRDTLEELRAADSIATAAAAEASAAADSTTAANDRKVAVDEVRSDSIASDLRAMVDATAAVLVDELEASHERVVVRLRATAEAERRARYATAVRVTVLEGQVGQLERIVATQAETIEEYERLEDTRVDQIRSLRTQRAGGFIIAAGAILCLFICGG